MHKNIHSLNIWILLGLFEINILIGIRNVINLLLANYIFLFLTIKLQFE